MAIISAFGVIGLAVGFSAGLGYYIYTRGRVKKRHWKARLYEVSDSVQKLDETKDGKEKSGVELNDINFKSNDIIIREEKEGKTVFFLRKEGLSVPEVKSDCVTRLPDGKKEVDVLVGDDQATILKKGYDKKSERLVYKPLPYDSMVQLKNDIEVHRDRAKEQQGFLQKVLPYIAIVMAFATILGVSYFTVDGMKDIAAEQRDFGNLALKYIDKMNDKSLEAFGYVSSEKTKEGLGEQKDDDSPPELE